MNSRRLVRKPNALLGFRPRLTQRYGVIISLYFPKHQAIVFHYYPIGSFSMNNFEAISF
jgi:hypothetical protein